MSASFPSKTQQALMHELRNAATPLPAFDRDRAAKIGTRVAMRWIFCRLSELQLGEGEDPHSACVGL